jgi:hypothetical protein
MIKAPSKPSDLKKMGHYNVTDYRLEVVTVGPGDYGRKFFPVDGYDKANNRNINRSAARDYWKVIDSIASTGGELRLMPRPRGGYMIIDGQHRIYGISEFGNRQIEMKAVIVPYSEYERLKENGFNLVDLIINQNKGKAFSPKDDMKARESESTWIEPFTKSGIRPVYNNSASEYNWPAVVRGYLTYGHFIKDGKVGNNPSPRISRNDIAEAWITAPVKDVEEIAEALHWWKEVTQAAHARRITGMMTGSMLGLAVLAYSQNKDLIADKDRIPLDMIYQKVSRFERLERFKDLAKNSNLHEAQAQLLAMLNYGAKINMFSIFGDNGR